MDRDLDRIVVRRGATHDAARVSAIYNYYITLREVGFKFERWIDVGYWQRMFVVLRPNALQSDHHRRSAHLMLDWRVRSRRDNG
jgi:hypothetical protein